MKKLKKKKIEQMKLNDLFKLSLKDNSKNESLLTLIEQYKKVKMDIKERFEDKVEKIRQGDELLPSVMKMVKVFLLVQLEYHLLA